MLVSAVYEVAQTEYDADRAVVPLAVARNLLNYSAEATAIELKIAPGVGEADAVKAAKSVVGGYGAVQTRLMQQEESFRMISVEKWLTFVMLVFILVIASFNIISTLSMMVLEKEPNMAVLRAMGATPRFVSAIFGNQGWLITLCGGGVGIVAGALLVSGQSAFGWIKLQTSDPTLLIGSTPTRWCSAPPTSSLWPLSSSAPRCLSPSSPHGSEPNKLYKRLFTFIFKQPLKFAGFSQTVGTLRGASAQTTGNQSFSGRYTERTYCGGGYFDIPLFLLFCIINQFIARAVKRIAVFLMLLMAVAAAFGQEAKVKRVEPSPMDLSASKYQRLDLNGKACALVRVEVLADDVEATGGKLENYSLSTLDLENSRQSVAGVDLNDEATSMMQFQKSYSAACQLMTTLDSMLDKLINDTMR